MKTDFQRWTAKRKVEVILKIIKGETSLVDLCREQDLIKEECLWLHRFKDKDA